MRAVPFRAPLLAAMLATLTLCASAQTVALQGMLGSKALLMVGGGAPRAVAPGETHQGVKVVSTSGDQAVVLIDGRRHTLRVGEAPASVGSAAPSGSDRVALTADGRGHFLAEAEGGELLFQFVHGGGIWYSGQADGDAPAALPGGDYAPMPDDGKHECPRESRRFGCFAVRLGC